MTAATHISGRATQIGQAHVSTSSLDVAVLDRSRVARRAKRHTWFVRFARMALPTVAVCAMGFYFIGSKFGVKINGVAASVTGVNLSTENLKMTNPRLEGFSSNNEKYIVTADHALQNLKKPDELTLNLIEAKLFRTAKSVVTMTAATGFFNTKTNKMDMTGGIDIVSTDGMKATLQTAKIDVKKQLVVSTDPVTAEMINGTIRANSIKIFPKERRVRFEGRVRVFMKKRSDPPPVQ